MTAVKPTKLNMTIADWQNVALTWLCQQLQRLSGINQAKSATEEPNIDLSPSPLSYVKPSANAGVMVAAKQSGI